MDWNRIVHESNVAHLHFLRRCSAGCDPPCVHGVCLSSRPESQVSSGSILHHRAHHPFYFIPFI